jgi:hypothetical protein
MATRYLRVPNPFLQILRHTSFAQGSNANLVRGGKKYGQQVTGVRSGSTFESRDGKAAAWAATRLKATYEPSPIFGLVKPTQKEALKKTTSPSKIPSKAAEIDKQKEQLTEDEKQV